MNPGWLIILLFIAIVLVLARVNAESWKEAFGGIAMVLVGIALLALLGYVLTHW